MIEEHEPLSDICVESFVRKVRNQTFQLTPRYLLDLRCRSPHALKDCLSHHRAQALLLEHVFCRPDGLKAPSVFRMQMLKIIIDALERSAQELDERFYETFLDTEMSRDNEPLLQEFSTLSQTPDEIEELCETRPPQDVRYFYNNRHPLRLDDDSIIVQEQPWLLTSGGITGHRTWEASLSLTDLLVSDPALIKDKCVLELGAGLGLLTCVCAKLGASSVTATDGEPSVVAKLKLTAERNMLEHIITAEKLEFGQDSLLERKKWDVVLAADVAYEDELIKDVLRTLRRLLDNSQPLVIFAATRRRPETMSFLRSTSNAMGLRLQQVLPSSTPGLALQSSEVVLFSIDLKPTALTAYDSDLSCERLAIVP